MTSTFQNESVIQDWESVFSETFLSVIKHVYLWMCAGLFLTASVSIALVYTPLFFILVQILEAPYLLFGLLIAEVGLVWWLSARIDKISVTASRVGFLVYAILNGLTMSVIFLGFTQSSIALTFVTTAGLFGIMGIIGYTTKRDLSKWGSYLLMCLIGFLIGSVANLFFASSPLEWMLTYIGILLFIVLTVYDTQKVKQMVRTALQANDENLVKRVGLLGALSLYLDFINLFLLLLRILGRSRD